MLKFPRNRSLACITIGRANIDLYPPLGQSLAGARTYDAFVGGSPANIAAGLVRRGLKAGIITKVADDGIGHFVRNYLDDFGIDTSQLRLERSGARTSLAFAERRRDASTVFYRQEPSDLLLSPEDIGRDYIAQAQVLFISGTSLCREPCRTALQLAIDLAREAGTTVALDIDYRPHGWTSRADAAKVLQDFAGQCDLLIGTADEFAITSGPANRPQIKSEEGRYFLDLFPQAELLVVKHGKHGANAYLNSGTRVSTALVPAAMKKPWGAGDAFASSLLASLLRGKSLQEAMRDGAAGASLNISGTSCTESMATTQEIKDFLELFDQAKLPDNWVD